MSFGTSSTVRFDHEVGRVGKPLVFWEQQAIVSSQKTNKKFKYMGREQKFTLRDKVKPEIFIEEMPAPRKPPAARKVDNKIGAKPVSKAGTKPNTANNRPSAKPSAKPNNEATKKKLPPGAGKPRKPTPETAGTVVLTQKQFDDILETIGNLTIEAEDAKKALEQSPKVANKGAKPDTSRQPDTSRDVAVAKDLPQETPGRTPKPTEPAPNVAPSSHTAPTTVEPDSIPGLTARDNKPSARDNKPSGELRKSIIGVPTAHLTKAEKKRLEWERERAESAKAEVWSPWGRPGAGAPIKDDNGNVVSDYNKRQETKAPQTKHTGSSAVNSTPDVAKVKISSEPEVIEPPVHEKKPPAPVSSRTAPTPTAIASSTAPTPSQGMNTTPSVTRSSRDQAPPAAVRSSFTIGNPAPNENRFMSAKERERKQWLEELEKQRQEQRERKQSERDKWRQEEIHDTWADRFATPKAAPFPEQQTSAPSVATQGLDDPQPRVEVSQDDTMASRVNSAPVLNTVQASEAQVSPRSHIRGQNVHIDNVTLKELEEKRRKHEENQAFIRQQIEEKEKIKREEKEKRMREEQAEEDRMRREREEIQEQLQAEKDRQRDKENEERMRLDTLKQAMEQAQEVAEREKHDKRMRKLQRAGHDVSHYNATFEDQRPPTKLQVHPAKMTPRVTDAAVHVEPSYVPGLFSARDTQRSDHTSPPREKVLTPTKHRYTPMSEPRTSPRREYASQTDHQDFSRESTGIEYTGPLYEKKKKVRVQSAPKDQVDAAARSRSAPTEVNQPENITRKKKVKLNERPKWGYSNPEKKRPVKQSEKDPFFEKKQREREFKRAMRQEKMQQMATKHRPNVSEVTTVASRARSRSTERKDNDIRSRSKSPPGDNYAYPSHQSRADSRNRPNMEYSHDQYSRTTPVHTKSSPRNASPGHRARSSSPPIPAIKHRRPSQYNADNYQADTSYRELHSRKGKYHDPDPVEPPLNDSQFVPFIRSTAVLDPAHADSPMPISREPTIIDKARKAYVQEHDPAKFGNTMDNYSDNVKGVEPQASQKPHRPPGDPILNPALVIEHPSGRQNRILQQLSDLRRGLMQKQKELEVGLPGMEQALMAE